MNRLEFERRAFEAKKFWGGDASLRAQLTWDLLLEVLERLDKLERK